MLTHPTGHPPARSRGITLVEVLIALVLMAILATLAYPSLRQPILDSRRSDALVALLAVQGAQERWRSQHPSYATTAELAHQTRSPLGRYDLHIEHAQASGYEAVATAIGAQAADTTCRVLRIRVLGLAVHRSSGPSASTANDVATNRRCWKA